jgi:hypothetical protein
MLRKIIQRFRPSTVPVIRICGELTDRSYTISWKKINNQLLFQLIAQN